MLYNNEILKFGLIICYGRPYLPGKENDERKARRGKNKNNETPLGKSKLQAS